ncbi:hypothetical protein [Ottowia cancrivicina]|uniref:Uncharacterized protein n=1 Tax=Ottowia cancrivicina TaxID=3040346 RepID=A0AAW6RMP9_9BURK|nr:hypothetical protein [Ottowia sp. 10c7w1]MDG9699851.1 hypothetical protein [Ottowia sp. 10c7w1]
MDIFRILLGIPGRKICLLIWRILQRYAYDPKIRSLFKKSRKHHCKPEKTPEKPVFILGSLGSTGPLNVDAERRKMPCAMRAGAVIYSSVFRARC